MKTVLSITFVIMFGIASLGCAMSPTQKYRQAADLYDTAMTASTFAIEKDWIQGAETDAVVALEAVAYARLVEMREKLLINKNADISFGYEEVLDLIRAIQAIATQEPEEPTEADTLPLPGTQSLGPVHTPYASAAFYN